MTVSAGTRTASGYASLLDEPNAAVQMAALEELNKIVDDFWPEVSEHIVQIESLYQDKAFPGREIAGLVGSKAFFHLEEYSDAVRFALGAGSRFLSEPKSEYTISVVSKIVDEYVKTQGESHSDPMVAVFVERLFAASLSSNDLKAGLGIAIETNRLDWAQKFIKAASGPQLVSLLSYCQNQVKSFVGSKSVRNRLLELMVEGYRTESGSDCDWPSVAYCLYHLNRPEEVADVICQLFDTSSSWGRQMALQVALDIASHEDQKFSLSVVSSLEDKAPVGALGQDEAFLGKITSILSGSIQSTLRLEFLFRNNQTDLLLLEALRSSIDQRSSVLHHGVVVAHAIMQTGTTNDAFLRKNLDWLAKSSHWSKFTATASLGAVHKGHVKDSKTLLATYLPAPGQPGGRAAYSEGGAFYAMGLIHANHYDADIEEYLRNCLTSAQGNEVLQVGASLGLGLTCLATRSAGVTEALKNVLFLDSAVAGEAAAYAIGLVMAGSGDAQTLKDLWVYAHETHHEKIIRACAVAMSLVLFEQEQEADETINQMLFDSDAIVRYGGVFAIGMAYCGTSQNSAVKQLLSYSVSDVSDDVKRAAVIALGLVLSNEPAQIPKVLKLLSQSFNPHVRYAVCFALGIGCSAMAATVPEAVALIEPLLTDVCEFVRQGAFIGMGLLFQETSGKKADEFREKIWKTPSDKHEDIMCRFGALIAGGLIDIGGRNSATSLFTKSDTLRLSAAVGFCLFSQMWYSYPLMLMVSLAATPTALIGLNEDLKMPRNFAVKSKTNPSLFAYPPAFKIEAKVDKSKLTSAVLSAAKGRVEPKLAEQADTDMKNAASEPSESSEKEPKETILTNPCRVVPAQESFIEFFKPGDVCSVGSNTSAARYVPLLPSRTSGFIILTDAQTGEPEDLLDFEGGAIAAAGKSNNADDANQPGMHEEEAPPPEAFEWEG